MAPYISSPCWDPSPRRFGYRGMSVTYADPDAYWVAQNFRKKVGQNFRNPQRGDLRQAPPVPFSSFG